MNRFHLPIKPHTVPPVSDGGFLLYGDDSVPLDASLPLRSFYLCSITCLIAMAFDELDRTTRYIRDAKSRALDVLNETSPKLTALEKAMWRKLKQGERPCKNGKN